jgi:hypothetical protein
VLTDYSADYTNSGAGYRQPASSAYGAYYDQQAYPTPHGDQGYDREQYPYEVPHHHAYASMYREGTPADYSKPGSAGNEPTKGHLGEGGNHARSGCVLS